MSNAQIERELEHEIENDDGWRSEEALATLSDREENRYQMQEIARRTVAKGLMKLSVKNVVSAENSEQWAIDIEHPAKDDDIRIFAEKPLEGWSTDYKIVRMLRWAGEESSRDPHKLEFNDLYMRKDSDKSDYAHGWRVVAPPDYDPPIKEQLAEHWASVKSVVKTDLRPSWTGAKMFGFMLAGVVAAPLLYSGLPSGMLGTLTMLLVNVISFLFGSLIGMVVLDK